MAMKKENIAAGENMAPATLFPCGYAKGPPWLFHGSALYQLHLVKAETARSFIPKEFKLVEAFGYTLGGFFLAHYNDSPAGTFDELVVIAGIVWNPPTSCAWAARVLVNSDEACVHGRKEIGLPSHVANFSKRVMASSQSKISKRNGFLNMIGIGSSSQNPIDHTEIQVTETKNSAAAAFCNIYLPSTEAKRDKRGVGPAIKMSLPSFSGRTEHNPHLLKYSCQIECRVQPVKPAKISGPNTASENIQGKTTSAITPKGSEENRVYTESGALNRIISILLSRPILALQFNSLKMQVEAPRILSHGNESENAS